MEKSFSIVDDEEESDDNSDLEEPKSSETKFKFLDKLGAGSKNKDEDSEENDRSPKKMPVGVSGQTKLSPHLGGGQTVLKTVAKAKNISSDSDQGESENEDVKKEKSFTFPNEYNPHTYANLDVDEEIKELFQYITKYTPQQLTLDFKLKPFIPEYLPAVGDIDAFLKVVPPETSLSGEEFDIKQQQLGFAVLDEPAANQSEPALLHLQLRASSVNVQQDNADVIVKKVENVEKNSKIIDKWIKDISDLHKSKSSPVVRYSGYMPDIDDLMQEWPEEMENKLKEHGFPTPESDSSLSEYIELVCDIFQIPVQKNKVQSLHLLYCLFAAVKNSQLYQVSKAADNKLSKTQSEKEVTDQLVLE